MSLNIYVRLLSDRSVVSTIPWTGALADHTVDLILRGLLRNTRDDCFVDFSEIYTAIDAERAEGREKAT